ncbi:MAG: hypothetical protein CMM93_00725, partial [Rickettsiales bacterium]|nr:hypothetical protein [Rickettsiales bacterium]
ATTDREEDLADSGFEAPGSDLPASRVPYYTQDGGQTYGPGPVVYTGGYESPGSPLPAAARPAPADEAYMAQNGGITRGPSPYAPGGYAQPQPQPPVYTGGLEAPGSALPAARQAPTTSQNGPYMTQQGQLTRGPSPYASPGSAPTAGNYAAPAAAGYAGGAAGSNVPVYTGGLEAPGSALPAARQGPVGQGGYMTPGGQMTQGPTQGYTGPLQTPNTPAPYTLPAPPAPATGGGGAMLMPMPMGGGQSQPQQQPQQAPAQTTTRTMPPQNFNQINSPQKAYQQQQRVQGYPSYQNYMQQPQPQPQPQGYYAPRPAYQPMPQPQPQPQPSSAPQQQSSSGGGSYFGPSGLSTSLRPGQYEASMPNDPSLYGLSAPR